MSMVAGSNVDDKKSLGRTLQSMLVERWNEDDETLAKLCPNKGYDNPTIRGLSGTRDSRPPSGAFERRR